MSGGPIQVQAEHLDPVAVLAQARAAAFDFDNPDSDACALLDVLRLCYATDVAARHAMATACAELLRQRSGDAQWRRDEPWPLSDGMLWFELVSLMGADLMQNRRLLPRGWACFRAIKRGAKWLALAAKLEPRDGHVMRRQGGLRLAPSVFDGERLRAQVVHVPASPGVPACDVLRLTWEDSARLVAQSKPGRFAELDPAAEPE